MLFAIRIATCLAIAVGVLPAQKAESLLEEARQAVSDGETAAAKAKFEAALEALAHGEDRARLRARLEYAEFLEDSSEPKAAAEQLQTAVSTLKRIHAEPVEMADLLLRLGGVEVEVNEDSAEARYLDALKIFLEELGPADEKTVETRAALGGLYLGQDWEEGAEEQFQAAMDARREEFGASEEFAGTLERISEQQRWSREEKALELRDQALKIREDLYADPSMELAHALVNEAEQRYQWDYDRDAVRMYRRATEILWTLDETPAALTARAHSGMADALDYIGEAEASESQYRTAIRIRRVSGLRDSELADDLCSLASSMRVQDRNREAVVAAGECVEIRRDLFEEDSYSLRDGLELLASAYRDAGRFQESEKTLRELQSIYQRYEEPSPAPRGYYGGGWPASLKSRTEPRRRWRPTNGWRPRKRRRSERIACA